MKTITTATFRTVEMPVRQMAYLRHIGPYMGNPALFERLFGEVMTWMQNHELMSTHMEAITVYHDDPARVPPEQQRISVGFTVPLNTKPSGAVQMMELPAGRYAVGSFELDPKDYGTAWEQIFDYIRANQLPFNPDGPMYEAYRNTPQNNPDGKHLVDICVALTG